MGRVVTPWDWAYVPRSFHVVVQAHPREPALVLRVVRLEDYTVARYDAPPVHTLALAGSKDPALRQCTVPRCPADGKYVLLVSEAANPASTVTYSGVRVSARNGWGPRNRRLPERPASRQSAAGPMFSVITTVYDIEPYMLEEAADSVLAQSMRNFEWIVLDNGSTLRTTSRAVDALKGRDPRIRHFRVDRNLHIVGGNRYLLERARGAYVLPMDADDLLHPDALAWLSRAVTGAKAPALVFADEEKVDAMGVPIEPIGRETWSRLSATSTVPCAHPTAFRRDTALELGVYSDERSLGSHDWDTALRFADAGHRGLYLPAVLYGWRLHGASTSLSATTKSYVARSQRHVVHSSLVRRGLERLFDIRETAVGAGYFHLARRKVEPSPVSLMLRARGRFADEIGNLVAALRATRYPIACLAVAHAAGALTPLARGQLIETARCASLPEPTFIETPPADSAASIPCPGWSGHAAIVDGSLRVTNDDWIWDALGALELDERVGWVGGHIEDWQGNIVHMGLVAGMDGGTPYYLQRREEVVWRNLYLRHRAVSGVHCGFTLVRERLAGDIGLPHRGEDSVASDVAWTRAAHRAGWIAAIAPGMRAVRRGPFEDRSQTVALPPNPDVFPAHELDPYYPRYYSRRAGEFSLVAPDDDRRGLAARLRRLLSL